MGRKFLFLVFSILFLPGCANVDQVLSNSHFCSKTYTFSASSWNEIFSHTEEQYFIYVYSETCPHCNAIKQDIEEFSNNSVYPLYFVEFSEEVPTGSNIEDTIGARTIDECFIKGIPALILIENRAISMNIAGTENILETIILYIK